MKNLSLLLLLALCAAGAAKAAEGTLTLEQAVAQALSNSPKLAGRKAEAGAFAGEATQARALPNPEIGIEAENIAGGGAYEGFDRAEITYGVRQTIEMSGKRSARSAAANYSLEAAHAEVRAAELDLIRDVIAAYMRTVAAKEKLALATEQRELAKELSSNVKKRVKAAASPLIQQSKANVAQSSSAIAVRQAEKELNISRAALSVFIGMPIGSSSLSSSELSQLKPPPVELDAIEAVKNNPDILKAAYRQERYGALVRLADAGVVPDPSLNVGVRDFRDRGDQAFIIGVSLPIPVFNQNRGGREKARQELAVAQYDRRQVELDLAQAYIETHAELGSAYETARTLEKDILPEATQAFRLAREGYEAGKFPYLEVLDAERTLFDAKTQYIDALLAYHLYRAELARITGQFLPKENRHE